MRVTASAGEGAGQRAGHFVARVASGRATRPRDRFAPDAWYRSALVPLPPSCSRPIHRRALGPAGVAALALLLSSACIEVSPYGDQGPAPGPAPKAPARVATAPSHGFNDAIAWRPLDEGLREAKAEGRPLMLVVHASWCERCKELKPAFHRDRIAELSERFVMVNADQDQTPEALAYAPDGSYIPRVLFIDPDTGNADAALHNPVRSRYHYYYGPNDDLPAMMEKALARHGKS